MRYFFLSEISHYVDCRYYNDIYIIYSIMCVLVTKKKSFFEREKKRWPNALLLRGHNIITRSYAKYSWPWNLEQYSPLSSCSNLLKKYKYIVSLFRLLKSCPPPPPALSSWFSAVYFEEKQSVKYLKKYIDGKYLIEYY